MSRHKRKPKSAPVRPAARPAPRKTPLWVVVAGTLVAAVVIAVANRFIHVGSRPAPDPVAAMDPEYAYREGLRIAGEGHTLASLPYFRRAAATTASDAWQRHHDYSSALANAALEDRREGGYGFKATRSSVERVELMRECIHEMDLAIQAAPGPRERAFLLARLGESLETWGLSLDAYGAYASAAALDTTSADAARRAAALLARLQHPERPD